MKYFRATDIKQAAAAIAAGAKPLAGGTVLVPAVAVNGGQGQTVVDIGRIADLRRVWSDNAAMYLGSTLSLQQIAGNRSIQSNFTALAEAAEAVGNPQVRRAATIGGNVALGLPTVDLVPALLALDGSVSTQNEDIDEQTTISNFVVTNRLITAIRLPFMSQRRSGFRKFAWRHASGITIVNVAVSICLDEGVISQPRVVAGGLDTHPQRLTAAESILNKQQMNPDVTTKSAAAAAEEATCNLTGPPGEKYRRRLLAYGVKEILARLSNGDV